MNLNYPLNDARVHAPAGWLLIDASRPGEVVMATAEPSATPRIERTMTYSAAEFPTFTNALQRFERDTGARLHGAECVLTIVGAVSGPVVTVARSRWTISSGGLEVMFGRPPTIINDMTARAWATLAAPPAARPIRRNEPLAPSSPGRRAIITVDDGVGAAIIDVGADGRAHVIDTEAGHAGFAPLDERDDRLLAALRRTGGATSWERVLTLSPEDPAWAQAMPGSARAERLAQLARLTGSFAGDLTLSFGAWRGVMLTGRRVGWASEGVAAFEQGFVAKRAFRRLLLDTPCWRLEQQDHVLRGATALLSRRYVEGRC